MSDVLRRWNELYATANGRAFLGAPGVRDPDAPCEAFAPGTPAGECISDGHYMCGECAAFEGNCACGQLKVNCECPRDEVPR